MPSTNLVISSVSILMCVRVYAHGRLVSAIAHSHGRENRAKRSSAVVCHAYGGVSHARRKYFTGRDRFREDLGLDLHVRTGETPLRRRRARRATRTKRRHRANGAGHERMRRQRRRRRRPERARARRATNTSAGATEDSDRERSRCH